MTSIKGKIIGINEIGEKRSLTIEVDATQFLTPTELSLTTIGKRVKIVDENL